MTFVIKFFLSKSNLFCNLLAHTDDEVGVGRIDRERNDKVMEMGRPLCISEILSWATKYEEIRIDQPFNNPFPVS